MITWILLFREPVQSVISELIASRRALVAGFPRHAADVPVVTGIGPVRILQSLRELVPADARHPVTDVVAVRQLVRGCAVRGLALQPAQFVIRVRA